jgi:hypothetical protein
MKYYSNAIPKSLTIEFDRDYGIDKRTGWSIKVDGRVVVELERFLLMALIKAVRREVLS